MDPLEPLDAAMMTAELLSEPLHTAAVLVLCPPSEAQADYVEEIYRNALTEATPLDPRFRRHPHLGVDTAGVWVWQIVDDVDMAEHLRRRTLPAGADRDALWKLVSDLHSEPLERSRPMWMAYLIDGLADGRFAFYIKVHHTLIDGVAGLAMIADALTTDPDRRSMPPIYADPDRHSVPAATTRRGRIPNPVTLIRSTLNSVASGLQTVGQVALGELSTVAAGLGGGAAVLPFDAPYTRFNGPVGPLRTFAGASWPKSRIRAVQAAAGVTGNDVLTAVVAGVLREWLLARDELPNSSLVAICPVTVRGRERAAAEDEHANLFGLQLCRLGTDLADPVERLEHIHRGMSWAKRQVAGRGANASTVLLAPSIALTVLTANVPFTSRIRRGYNVSISGVPGPSDEMYWNGAHLEEIYPVSTAIDGQALNVTMCSYADRVTFGYISGRDVVPDIESLVALTERALSELETATGASA
ncbi:wax ester/triacylglycerol synthase family O-acyltransferase [Mycobacterium sp. SMC-4]|uniref:wax ester/triacylglycerol synthase family O-acyltransferase n=1 Tax=Mycobacterium sp. SMC-4 TaxID=2857059 RepID=UPI0021B2D1CC|nr:wax ester/triacylglycerol synthase family O-acyltransferase [Mycobacterium sp. SMC-4]UXA18470.1 wax ester/triacylglycerol synthase family O-acyltransferase [Mycobacterium sp. SMC-4]